MLKNVLELVSLDKCISCTVLKLFNNTKSSKSPYRPTQLYETLKKKNERFRKILNGRMQDAHEFLLLAAEGMETQKHSFKWFEDNFITDVRTIVQCLTCKTVFESNGHWGDFCLNINKQKSVQSALDVYFDWESVNGFDCNCCKKKVMAKKKYSLVSTPLCLCITLERFTKSSKINSKIEITLELTTSEYFVETPVDHPLPQYKYKLVAVINHLGKTLSSGHYTAIAYVQNEESYEFNDSNVCPINKDAIKGDEAYILFYQRIEVICNCS